MLAVADRGLKKFGARIFLFRLNSLIEERTKGGDCEWLEIAF